MISHMSAEECAGQIVDRLGKDLRVAMPLGLGKPVALIDALYQRACVDPELKLTIITALTLERPTESEPVRGRLLNPVFDRLYAHYREPLYARDGRLGALPENVVVNEFYFKAGSRLGNSNAQQNYISSNYTHAARDVVDRGCNVVMQLLAREGDALSMSCNPDTSAEVVARLREKGEPFVAVGVMHSELPFMYGDAEVDADQFDILMETDPQQHGLFVVPRLPPVPAPDYAIGLHASTLIKDGGTLQLGIGAMGDAIVQAVRLRHQNNDRYRQLVSDFGIDSRYGALVASQGGLDSFSAGLYGATEMFVEGFLHLFEAGVLRRPVYDFWALQQAVNMGLCDPAALTAQCLPALAELGVRELRGKDFEALQYHGFFHDQCRYREGHLFSDSGESCPANMANPDSQAFMAQHCLGQRLRNGKVLHGGFFLGSGEFYRRLRDLPSEQRRQLAMCGVDKINQLDRNPRLFKAQRVDARFINTGLNVSLNGAVASDTLENGQVLSGVGGQYNFVAMAHQLDGGRSILMIRSTRRQGGQRHSNVVPSYGACTIPRHLRDIVITEYGIADLRGKTDAEVAAALIAIADSEFQPELIRSAQANGKLPTSFELQPAARDNHPARISELVARATKDGSLPPYPLGCDFRDEELAAAKALQAIASMSTSQRLAALLRGGDGGGDSERLLATLGLQRADTIKERFLRRLLTAQCAKQVS